jgi:hypothetical protein
MEIQLLHKMSTEKNTKLLMDHVRRMASGEAPFFPATLGLVYYKLVEEAPPTHPPSDPGPDSTTRGQDLPNPTPTLQELTPTSNITSPNVATSNVTSSNVTSSNVASSNTTPSYTSSVASVSTRSITSIAASTTISSSTPTITRSPAIGPASSSNLQAPTPRPRVVPLSTTTKFVKLKCIECSLTTSINGLYGGMYCPRCPKKSKKKKNGGGRPLMQCAVCYTLRGEDAIFCSQSRCGGKFV